MLTGDLVRVRVQQKELLPSYLDHPRHLEGAEELLRIFEAGVGRTREELTAEVDELVGDRTDHKVTRGLAKLISDGAEWASESPVPPAELRERLWTRAAQTPSRATADAAYAEQAQELGLPSELLRALLFADRKEEQQLVSLPSSTPEALLARYDVALVQALLLKATELRIVRHEPAPERLRQLFTAVRFHQLMVRAKRIDGGIEVLLDGPASLLKQTSRYGMSLAQWFPKLLLQPGRWELEATVLWTARRLRKTLRVDSARGLRSHLRDTGAYKTQVEAWFEERWEKLETGWTLEREGVVLDLAGEAVICPVYTLRQGGRTAYLEILGFWRKDWLKRHAQRVHEHGPGNLVLAVSERLAADKGALSGLDVIPFKEILNAKAVLEAVERLATR